MLGAAQCHPIVCPPDPGLMLCTALHSGHVHIMSALDLLSLFVLAPMNTSSIMPKALIVND
jgi:hypothetical protein